VPGIRSIKSIKNDLYDRSDLFVGELSVRFLLANTPKKRPLFTLTKRATTPLQGVSGSIATVFIRWPYSLHTFDRVHDSTHLFCTERSTSTQSIFILSAAGTRNKDFLSDASKISPRSCTATTLHHGLTNPNGRRHALKGTHSTDTQSYSSHALTSNNLRSRPPCHPQP
jgi:hypothetical protein